MWFNGGQELTVSKYFGVPQFGHTIKSSYVKVQTVDPGIYSI